MERFKVAAFFGQGAEKFFHTESESFGQSRTVGYSS
jgi:hypothetical protein